MVKSGQIINTRGLKGECKVYLYTDEPESRFVKGMVFVTDDGRSLEVQRATPFKNMLYVFFKEIQSIEQAETYKGQNLWVDESRLPALDEDEFYYHELMNSKVYNQNEEYLGEVSDILETGPHLNLRIKKGPDSFLLPFVDAFLEKVDRHNKVIVIKEWEGLR